MSEKTSPGLIKYRTLVSCGDKIPANIKEVTYRKSSKENRWSYNIPKTTNEMRVLLEFA